MKLLSVILLCALTLGSLSAQELTLDACRHALKNALRLNHRDSLASAYCHLGEYYAYRNSDSARYYFEKGLSHVRRSDVPLYCTLLINTAETYFAKGDLDEAVRCFRFAYREVERLQAAVEYQVTALSSLGVIYRRQAMPDSALVCYTQALQALEPVDLPDEEMFLLTNIAILYANMKRMEEGRYYIEKAMELVERCQDLDMVMYACSTAGVILGHLKQYDLAVTYLQQVIHRGEQEQKPRFVLKGMTYLLGILQKMNKPHSIKDYLYRAEQVADSLPQASVEVQGFRETQFQLLTYLGQYRESLEVQQKLLQEPSENAQVSRDELYYRMAQNYAALKDFSQASEAYEKARVLADSLKQATLEDQLSKWTVKYQTQEKEMEIARLRQQQLEQQTRILLGSMVAVIVVFVLLLVIIGGIICRKQQKKEAELQVVKSYIEGLERERSRLAKDLHDGVCNDLLGIGMQVSFLQPDEASKQEVLQLLERVRQEVRAISHELMPPQFKHLTLVQAVEAYLDRLPHSESKKYRFMYDENDDWNSLPESVSYAVYRVLQEWLSNVWKHTHAPQVEIRLTLHADLLKLLIVNEGEPFISASSSGKGIGLTTIQDRVKSIGGTLSLTHRDGKQIFELSSPLS